MLLAVTTQGRIVGQRGDQLAIHLYSAHWHAFRRIKGAKLCNRLVSTAVVLGVHLSSYGAY